jgi:hypothetical protein
MADTPGGTSKSSSIKWWWLRVSHLKLCPNKKHCISYLPEHKTQMRAHKTRRNCPPLFSVHASDLWAIHLGTRVRVLAVVLQMAFPRLTFSCMLSDFFWCMGSLNKCTKNKKFWEELIAYFPWYDTNSIENDVSNNYSIVGCVFVTAVTFLPSRCLATVGEFLPNRAAT